tara:strand:+ start:4547 stop:5320 length:774 start_codon:yes stop_codon:yes gene_type:complete
MLPKSLKPKKNYQLVRLGEKYDGGYLVDLNSIHKSEFLISGGIFYDFKFEQDYLNLSDNKQIYCYDHMINPYIYLIKWILILFKRLIFFEKLNRLKKSIRNILKPIKFLRFIKEKRVNYYKIGIGNEGKNFYSLKKIVSKISNNKVFFLKIDIEGDEYGILNQILEYSENLSGLVIEFHNVEKNIHLIEDFIKSFKLELIYIHVNNVSKLDTNGLPSIIEMSFSKFAKTSDNLAFRKHELDFPNNPYLSNIDLTFQD